MASVFILGPSLEVTEPEPAAAPSPEMKGRRGIAFDDPPTIPGGKVNLKLLPANDPADVLPTNVYAFFVTPPSLVPAVADRTYDWFFKSPHPNGSTPTAHVTDAFQVSVTGVVPGVHHVQTILEYQV